MKRFFGIIASCILFSLLSSCYTLLNSSIPPALKTINVQFFDNNAALVVGTLSTQFTEALKERIRTQSRLGVVRGEADATMSGSIVDYGISPASVQATANNVAPIADVNKLTISVKVKFTYDADKKLSFEQVFTQSKNFRGDIGSQEQGLINDINKMLTEDIFNKAFSNW